MLHEFIAAHRDTIIAEARTRLQNRSWSLVSPEELEHGVPLFLTQLVAILQTESGILPKAESAMAASASEHGRDLRTHVANGRLRIEVEDECGGIHEESGNPFAPFADRRGRDRSGLGMGLSIARKAVQAHGGDITITNNARQGVCLHDRGAAHLGAGRDLT